VAETEHEHHQADADAEKADNPARRKKASRGNRCSQAECEGEIGPARKQALDHGDLNRIAGRQFTRKVVVDTLGKTRRGNQQPANIETCSWAIPRQNGSAREDGKCADQQAPVHIFPEHQPRDAHSR